MSFDFCRRSAGAGVWRRDGDAMEARQRRVKVELGRGEGDLQDKQVVPDETREWMNIDWHSSEEEGWLRPE